MSICPGRIRGVEISILYAELPDGRFKLSLRSKGNVNVERVARVFGGGGHINAAACRMEGELVDIRRRVLEAIRASGGLMNGVIVIDKPSGRTSRAVVEEVKRALGIRKAGHTGTLDPLATGVLPVCINEATKLVQFLALDTKEYRATLLLGVTDRHPRHRGTGHDPGGAPRDRGTGGGGAAAVSREGGSRCPPGIRR